MHPTPHLNVFQSAFVAQQEFFKDKARRLVFASIEKCTAT